MKKHKCKFCQEPTDNMIIYFGEAVIRYMCDEHLKKMYKLVEAYNQKGTWEYPHYSTAKRLINRIL